MPHSPRPRRGCRMTERRPHWDTELEQAVSAVLFDCYENGISEEQVYQVIAAVEDWVLSAPIFDLYLSRKHAPDKAAIARVRQVLDEEQRGYNPPLGLISRIKTALEGDSDD